MYSSALYLCLIRSKASRSGRDRLPPSSTDSFEPSSISGFVWDCCVHFSRSKLISDLPADFFNSNEMALQLGLRRTLTSTSFATSKCASQSALGGFASQAMRLKSTDAGDVIGIDLGTTNSCVAIMVRRFFAANINFGRLATGLPGGTTQSLTHFRLFIARSCSLCRKEGMHALSRTARARGRLPR